MVKLRDKTIVSWNKNTAKPQSSEKGGKDVSRKKQSRLSADAKIILSLMKKQPQITEELCKNAGVKIRNFKENRRGFLIDEKIIKYLSDGRWALWDYESSARAWQPHSGEVKFCIEVLEANDNEETTKAFLSELRSILNSGYWDNRLEDFFIRALDRSEGYEEKIEILLRADPKNHDRIELFLKNNRNKIYNLIESSGKLCSLALRTFIDVSDGNEALDRMEEDLKGEEAERVIMAAQGCGRKLYDKFKLDFKIFLRLALKHESEIVKQCASNLMNEITEYQGD